MVKAIGRTIGGLFVATLFIAIILYFGNVQQGAEKSEVEVSAGSVCVGSVSVTDDSFREVMQETTAEIAYIKSLPVEKEVILCGQAMLNSVKEIDLNEVQIDDLALLKEELAQFYQLKRVEMCNTNLTDEEMDSLCKMFPETKFVWVVHCGSFAIRTDAVAFSTMFTGYGWDPMTEADFEPLKYCTDLEALDIGHHSIRDLSFLKDLKKMKILIIAINRYSDITPLTELKNITYLELFLNDIQDLSPLEGLVNIEHLNLCHNKNLGEIDPILHYTNLKRLWISYCNLTGEEIATIKETYPDAQLEFDVYESVEAGWRSTEVYTRMRDVFNHNQMDEMFLPKVQYFEE